MAQTSSRSNIKAVHILGLLNLLLLLQNAYSYEFKVGGSGQWSAPSDPSDSSYTQWAHRSRFQVGDTLLFVYPADKDSVLLVTKEDYADCNTASPIEKYSDGHSVVKFNHSGPFHFISGVHENCVKNEKLVVVVMADRSNRNQTSTSPPSPSPAEDVPPSPAPPAAEVPPSPAPSGEEAPSPPPGSAETNPTPAPSQESSPPKNAASTIVLSFISSTATILGSSIILGF